MELEVRNLSKSYKGTAALTDFSCTFKTGITAVLGPNGAGKSTLIHLLTDNVTRDSGEILFEGKDILALKKEYRRRIGFMPQEQGAYGEFTAKTFLFYMAAVKGLKKREAKRQIEELLNLTGLKHAEHRRLDGFSGGMKQRVMFIQALLGDPQIVILDEPTAGLDIEERIRMSRFIESYAKDRIVIWCTHIASDIERTAAEILIMKEGRKIILSTPEQLMLEKQAKSLEEAYLRYMNS